MGLLGELALWVTDPIPHVIGLSREVHRAIEAREKKIALVGGKWLAYDKDANGEWVELGELSPQPGARGSKSRKRFKGEKRRKRKTISLRVPDDAGENGAALLDEGVEALEEKINPGAHRPIYYTLMSALDYANLNADETDFVQDGGE